MKHKRGIWRPLLIIVLDLVLIAALVKVFSLEKNREMRSQRTLNRAVSKVAAEMPESELPENFGDELLSGPESAEDPAALSTADSAEEPALPVVLSVRGDSFAIHGGDPQTAYPAILEQKLSDAGYQIRVMDYTLDARSALTHLYYAGIDESEIQEYVDRNAESDRVRKSSPFESGTGDVSGLSLQRNDYEAIPVIFVGYYGGWGGDVFELIEMQQKILSTYSSRDRYIIVCNHPLNVTDVDTFDEIMSAYWGREHYLGVVGVSGSALTTLAGHEDLAQRILTKLEKQKYLS